MHTFVNLCPRNYYDESETILIEIPSALIEEVLPYIRSVEEQQNISKNAATKKLLLKAYDLIVEEYHERKNRKTKKR
ncbi:hypothetical protein SWPG_00061 [Synechococcus phage S-CBM2]|nr:hypothetical protein SWPG_00061 [Synechococcus phage S-CBM2]